MGNKFLPAALLSFLLAGAMSAQVTFFPTTAAVPQAKTEAELDAFGVVFESHDAEQTIQLSQIFLQDYPDSEFRLYALIRRMHAYEAVNNYQGVVATGEEILSAWHDNIDALITLSSAIADRVPPSGADRERLLSEAESYANRAREFLATLKKNRSVPRQQFRTYKQKAEALTASAFGLIALQSGNFQKALKEYELATSLHPQPRGVDFYRLGIAYLLSGQVEQAQRPLRRARELGPSLIRELAERQLQDLKLPD